MVGFPSPNCSGESGSGPAYELVIGGTGQAGLEGRPGDQNVGGGLACSAICHHADRVVRIYRHDIAHRRRDQSDLMATQLHAGPRGRPRTGRRPPSPPLFVRGDEVVAVAVPSQDRREQPNQLFPAEPHAFLPPGAVAADLQADIPAVGRVPQMYGREGSGLFQTRFHLQGGNQVRERVHVRGYSVRHGQLGLRVLPTDR